MPRYSACNIGCDELDSSDRGMCSAIDVICSTDAIYDLQFDCSSADANDASALQTMVNTLESDDLLDCNCGFLTSFDMEYELGCDGAAEFLLRIIPGMGAVQYQVVNLANDAVIQSTNDLEVYLDFIAALFCGFVEERSGGSFSGCDGDPGVRERDRTNNAGDPTFYDCVISGNSIGGSRNYRFDVDSQSDRDAFCGAVQAMIQAKWLGVNGFYNGGTPCYADGLFPCDDPGVMLDALSFSEE